MRSAAACSGTLRPTYHRVGMRWTTAVCVALALGCASAPPRVAWPASHPITPDRFNHIALRLDLPLYWVSDDWTPRQPQPRDIRQLLFYPASGTPFVRGSEFTPAFETAIALMRDEDDRRPPEDDARDLMVWMLDHTPLALVETDLSTLDAPHQAFLDHVLEMTRIVDALYARQQGADRIAPLLDPLDLTAQSALRLNLGCSVWHDAPAGTCQRLASPATAWLGIYPIALQMQDGYCAQLAADSHLRSRQSVIIRTNTGWGELPYAVAYADLFARLRAEMTAAADALEGADEPELALYLRETAHHFQYGPDDRDAWGRLVRGGSRWYLGFFAEQPDWEPCGRRGGIGLTFGTIDAEATAWTRWLRDDRDAMEAAIADASNGSYAARDVRDVVGPVMVHVAVQGGHDRYHDSGAFTRDASIIVQTNTSLATQTPRSAEADRNRLCWGMQAQLPTHETSVLHAALHELGHALGPPLRGETRTAFGDDVRTIHELIAEATTGLLVDWLAQRGRIDAAAVRQLHQWQARTAIGTMVDGDARDPHWAAEAFLLGRWIESGAVTWQADHLAFDRQGAGCFAIDFDRWPETDGATLAEVLRIATTGDRAAFVDAVARYAAGVLPVDAFRQRQAGRAYRYVYAIDR